MRSSVVSAFTYNEKKKILKVTYVSGMVYHYLNVPPAIYNAMIKVKSKGTYLNTKIKGRFEYEKVYEP